MQCHLASELLPRSEKLKLRETLVGLLELIEVGMIGMNDRSPYVNKIRAERWAFSSRNRL